MRVLIDSTVWSLGLRRRPDDLSTLEREIVDEWSVLIREGRVVLIGPVRQEVLSGIRHQRQFEVLRQRLAAFPNLAIEDADYVQAARFFNRCRAKGIAATPIDLLLCAVSHRVGLAIFTTDQDFEHYARHVPIQLHELRSVPE